LRFLKELPVLIVVALTIALLIKALVVQAFYIEQQSMLPTLEPGQRVLVGKYSYRFGEPKRGDVIIFQDPRQKCGEADASPACNPALTRKVLDWFAEVFGLPTGSKEDLVKRIVGLPGETIAMSKGQVFVCDGPACDPISDDGVPIDGRKIEFPHDEHRGPQADQANLENVTIPADNYFVLGDNRAASADSRSFGAVPRKQFVGKVVLRIWPPGGVRGG
jgi:signal peptidase I